MERILTRKGAVIELAIVTAGVLIALSFDTVREWRSNQVLAAEARTNLMNEIRQNKRQLDAALAALKDGKQQYTGLHRRLKDRIARKPQTGPEPRYNLNVRLAGLSSAAYTTAEITGAFGYMRYEDVRRFASLYDFQQRYVVLEDEALRQVSSVTGPIMLADDDAPVQEIEVWRRGLEGVIGGIDNRSQMGELLSRSYAAFLDAPEPANASEPAR